MKTEGPVNEFKRAVMKEAMPMLERIVKWMNRILEAIERWYLHQQVRYAFWRLNRNLRNLEMQIGKEMAPALKRATVSMDELSKALKERERAYKPIDRKDCSIQGYQASEFIEDEWLNPPSGGSNVDKGEVKNE
jgi:hypothetical protein